MLKGKSKIELFDGLTGKKQNEYNDENLVTNAVANIFDVPPDWIIGGYSMRNLEYYYLPMYQKLYGGVLLFDETLTESADNITAPATIGEVGHAGGVYSGTNTYRGTYNSNESGAVTDGWRHVWDFATDRANGTIRSLSLTSLWGGNIGLNGLDSDTAMFLNPQLISTANTAAVPSYSSPRGSADSNYSLLCGLPDGRIVYGRLENGGLTLKYVAPERTGRIKLMGSNTPFNDVTETTVLINPDYRFPLGEKCLYVTEDYTLVSLCADDSSTVFHNEVNLTTGTVTVSEEITFSESIDALQKPSAKYQNEYIAYSSTRLKYCRYSLAGQFIAELFTLGDSGCSFGLVAGRLMTGPVGLSKKLTFWNGSEISYQNSLRVDYNNYNTYYLTNIPSGDIKLPYCRPWQHTSGIMLYTPYLGTINNLETAVAKTSAQTMKVTYEIYNA